MIRPLILSDRDRIHRFCLRHPALNLYFLGNLKTLGVESELCQFWGSFDALGDLNGLLMRYIDGWNIADAPGCDYAGFGKIVDGHPAGASRLQDNTRSVASFLPFIHSYQPSSILVEVLCTLSPSDFRAIGPDWPTRRAGWRDFHSLKGFYASAEDMTRSDTGVRRPLQSGRVFVTEVDAAIVSAALTNAETDGQAMIGGVYTPPQFRRKGYATAAMITLCHSLMEDGLEAVLYYGNPAAGRIYAKLGFKEIGHWRSVRLVPR